MKRQMKIVLDCVSLGGCRSSHDVAEELSSEFAFLLYILTPLAVNRSHFTSRLQVEANHQLQSLAYPLESVRRWRTRGWFGWIRQEIRQRPPEEAELIKRRSVLICCHGRRSRHVSSSRHVAHKPVSLRGAAPHRTHVPSSGRALSTSLIMTFVAASASATVAQVKARTAEEFVPNIVAISTIAWRSQFRGDPPQQLFDACG